MMFVVHEKPIAVLILCIRHAPPNWRITVSSIAKCYYRIIEVQHVVNSYESRPAAFCAWTISHPFSCPALSDIGVLKLCSEIQLFKTPLSIDESTPVAAGKHVCIICRTSSRSTTIVCATPNASVIVRDCLPPWIIDVSDTLLLSLIALLLVVMNNRGKFHSHRARHRGGWAELVWWCPQGVILGGHKILSPPRVLRSQNLP